MQRTGDGYAQHGSGGGSVPPTRARASAAAQPTEQGGTIARQPYKVRHGAWCSRSYGMRVNVGCTARVRVP